MWYCSFWSEGSKHPQNLNIFVQMFVPRDLEWRRRDLKWRRTVHHHSKSLWRHSRSLRALIRGPWGQNFGPKCSRLGGLKIQNCGTIPFNFAKLTTISKPGTLHKNTPMDHPTNPLSGHTEVDKLILFGVTVLHNVLSSSNVVEVGQFLFFINQTDAPTFLDAHCQQQ